MRNANMNRKPTRLVAASIALALGAALPFAAEAHRPFLVPSETVLSRTGWITVDGAVSNDLFYFNHQPLRLDNLLVVGPDGQPVQAQNANTGKFRSTFDLNLDKPGTYKLALVSSSLNAQFETAAGERRRWRGTPETLGEIPADAKNVQITQQQQRNETFVTAGKPNDTVLKPTGIGLELVPVTHPNDLVAGEPISFKFVLDGKPAANLEVDVVPGGTRYRDKQNESKYTTDKNGQITMTWNDPGMYWLQADVEDDKTSVKQAKSRRASYIATFEVLPP
ncbi:MAG: DUF4198 domain-containing protein [Gammaproteobacteria bacterium]